MAKLLSSPLVSASNNIVLFAKGTKQLPRVQRQLVQFDQFIRTKTVELEKLKLPDKKKIKELAKLNIASSFGAPGGLLRSLASGALDVAGFLGNMFPAKGKTGKPGRLPKRIKAPKPTVKGSTLKLGGIRAVGVVNTLFAGLDFATGLQEGESVGKAAAGAGGSLAGSLLGGAIGQALIPIPGVGFVLGSMAGGFLGGYAADRVYEGGSSIKKKLSERLKKQEAKQKGAASGGGNFGDIVSKFSSAVSKFEQGVASGLFGSVSPGNSSRSTGSMGEGFDEPTEYPKIEETPKGGGYDGPVTGDTFFPLPGGKAGQAAAQQYGAPRDGGTRPHLGLDMTHHVGALNAQVVAYKTGKVIAASHNRYNGHVTVDHGGGLKTRYYHTTPSVNVGDTVYGGQKIANIYPDGGNTHLHFEMYRGGTPINPSSGGLGQKLPGPLTAEKAKEQHEKNKSSSTTGAPTAGAPTAILAAGTNDYTDPKSGAAGVTKAIKEMQAKGYNVVVVPPNESGKFAGVSKSVQEAAIASGATIEKGKYDQNDPLHLQMSEASRIREKYGKNAKIIGDSNAVRIAGGSMQDVPGQRVVGAGTKDISKFAQNMPNVAPKPQNPAPTIAPPPPPPQAQVQQYPTYNQQQSSVTIMPIMMGGGNQGGGGQQQKPVFIPVGGGGGGGTVILPGPSEGAILNSLWKTMLLTNLSAA